MMEEDILEKYFTADIAFNIVVWGFILIAAFYLVHIFVSWYKAFKSEEALEIAAKLKVSNMAYDSKVHDDDITEFVNKNYGWVLISYDIADRVNDYMNDNHISSNGMSKLLGESEQYVDELLEGGKNLTIKEVLNLQKVMGYKYLRLIQA